MIALTNAHRAALLAMRAPCEVCLDLGVCAACMRDPTADELAALGIDTPAPTRKTPQLPAEVWNSTPVSAERAMSAVRAMCGSRS